jgi:hypothetical protein
MKRVLVGIAALIVPLLSTTGVLAEANLNCDAYAGAAVAQSQQNEIFKCGFSGPAWSSDFNAHRQWCLAPATKMQNLTAEDNARKQALAQCAEKPKLDQAACQVFAKKAMIAVEGAAKRGCGFGGNRWVVDHGAHFNWCLSASPESRDQENQARTLQLQGCRDSQVAAVEKSKKDACAKYAGIAVAQNQENLNRKCEFTGGLWSGNWQTHFDYCQSVGVMPARKETLVRIDALKSDCMRRVCTKHTKTTLRPPFIKTITKCRNVQKSAKAS